MKKVFCFHCQKDITPLTFGKWRFCPHCFRQTTDNGEGLYLVCDKCGANLPVDSIYCLKCGHGVNGHRDNENFLLPPVSKTWLHWLIQAGLLLFSLFLAVGIIYLSFYFLLIFFVLGLGYYLYNSFSKF